jgi:hypothetical protein
MFSTFFPLSSPFLCVTLLFPPLLRDVSRLQVLRPWLTCGSALGFYAFVVELLSLCDFFYDRIFFELGGLYKKVTEISKSL